MPRPHPPEFRRRAIELAREKHKPVVELARDLGISESCLRNWMSRADVEEGRRDGAPAAERAELVELRRKLRVAELENEILRRAAAYFARENVLPLPSLSRWEGSGCSRPVTPRVRCAWRGTPRRSSAPSTTTPTPTSPWSWSTVSAATSKTAPARPRCGQLGRTLVRWRDQIAAWHQAHVTNGPTEAANNLIKRIKRVAFGFTRFRNYQIRALLYAGRPNWELLATVTPP